jgi:hypothetical protein
MTEIDLTVLLEEALRDNRVSTLETHLLAHSRLPGPRANLKQLHAFADAVEISTQSHSAIRNA